MSINNLLLRIRELEKNAGIKPKRQGEMDKWSSWEAINYLQRLEDLNLKHFREIRLMEKKLGVTPTSLSKIEEADIIYVLNYLDKLEAGLNRQQVLPPT